MVMLPPPGDSCRSAAAALCRSGRGLSPTLEGPGLTRVLAAESGPSSPVPSLPHDVGTVSRRAVARACEDPPLSPAVRAPRSSRHHTTGGPHLPGRPAVACRLRPSVLCRRSSSCPALHRHDVDPGPDIASGLPLMPTRAAHPRAARPTPRCIARVASHHRVPISSHTRHGRDRCRRSLAGERVVSAVRVPMIPARRSPSSESLPVFLVQQRRQFCPLDEVFRAPERPER